MKVKQISMRRGSVDDALRWFDSGRRLGIVNTSMHTSRCLLLSCTESMAQFGRGTYQAKKDNPGRSDKPSEDCGDELRRNLLLGAERVEDFGARVEEGLVGMLHWSLGGGDDEVEALVLHRIVLEGTDVERNLEGVLARWR